MQLLQGLMAWIHASSATIAAYIIVVQNQHRVSNKQHNKLLSRSNMMYYPTAYIIIIQCSAALVIVSTNCCNV